MFRSRFLKDGLTNTAVRRGRGDGWPWRGLQGDGVGRHAFTQTKQCGQSNQAKQKLETVKTQTGVEYRQKVLSRGGSVDADEMLLAFLGRAPTQDAFLQQLGLVASTTP